jgi:HSP20 family molecular chaperone IbpA
MSDLQNEKAPSNGAPLAGASAAATPPAWRATPELDLYEGERELLVLLNVPGASPESINVQVIGNELSVRAEQAAASYADVARVAFERRFELPAEVDGSSATAELRNGVLEVRLQKSASARRVKIPVSAN